MKVENAEWGSKPNVYVRDQHDGLNKPNTHWTALMAIRAGTKREIGRGGKILSAMRTGRMRKPPRNRQDIRKIINNPAADPASQDGDHD